MSVLLHDAIWVLRLILEWVGACAILLVVVGFARPKDAE